MGVIIERETPDQIDVRGLLRQSDERSSRLYPAAPRYGPSLEALLQPNVRFFVARFNGKAEGCGGYAVGRDGTAELKRIFVSAHSRRLGIGRALLETIETSARHEGIRTMLLETGVKSEEARRLYGRLGYRERNVFGDYLPDELSVFMEKKLDA